MIQDPLAIFFVLAGVVYLSIRLEKVSRTVKSLGSVLVAILLGAVLANLGLIPGRSEAYQVLGGVGVNLGIALILLAINVRTISRAGLSMLLAFGLGGLGTVLGAVLGTMTVARFVGPETWKLAGQYAATYLGGSVNFVTVGRGLETSPDLFSAGIAADNVTTTVWMAACLAAPALLGRFWIGRSPELARTGPDDPEDTSNSFNESERTIKLSDAALLVLVASGSLWAADVLSKFMPGIPEVLWLTTVALALAQLPPVRDLSGSAMLGNYAMHLFLAAIGAQSVVAEILRVGPAVFYFTLVVIGFHGVFIFGLGRLLRIDLPTLTVASQANVGGPATAMALASAKGYHDRLLPGVAVGLMGYAVGSYAGFGVAALMRAWMVA